MTFLKLILLLGLSNLVRSYPYFPECDNSIGSNVTLINSLNGKIQGKCYNVTVNYGSKAKSSNLVLTWLAIPYAEPPIGKLRFKNPKPVKSWTKTLNATKWGKSCTQWDGDKIDKDSSENCLFLNIFAPYTNNNNQNGLPIFVWVHGGSNYGGSATDDTYEASTLVAMSNIIVVTINYRLGPFGFFTIKGTDAKGNQGFLDQSLAFKWVYENAPLFGGDRSRITIGGESAGSWDVGYHLVHKPSWPYFSQAILESGSPVDISSRLRTPEKATLEAVKVGEELDCDTSNSTELFTCLQAINAKTFYEAASLDFGKLVDLFMPEIFDGEVFTKQPRELFESGEFKKCNLLIGTNDYEFLAFVSDQSFMSFSKLNKTLRYNPGKLPYNLTSYYKKYNFTRKYQFYNKMLEMYVPENKRNNKSANVLDSFIDMITDESYKCPTYLLADYYSSRNLSTYVYMYGHRISTSDLPPVDGAGHGEELSMVFAEPLSIKKPPLISGNSHSSTTHNYSLSERVFTEQIVNYWTNFIKNGNPNAKNNNSWPLYKDSASINERNIYFLKANGIKNTKFNISDEKCLFWNL